MIARPVVTAVLAMAAAIAGACGDRPETTILGPRDGHTVEGIWQMSGDGAVFDISALPGYTGRYTLTIIDSPDYSVEPGTFFGTLTATPSAGRYDAALVLDPAGKSRSSNTRNFVFEFDESLSACTMQPYSRGKRISLRRMVPYLFRIVIEDRGKRPDGLDGAVRIDSPPKPIVL